LQLRERGGKTLGQPGEGLEFAVLLALLVVGLGAVLGGIFDELAFQRDRQAGGGDELGFEDGVEVHDRVTVLLGQAVCAVPLVKGEHPGAVDRHDQMAQEPKRVQGPHPNQAAGTALTQGGQRFGPLTMFQEMIHGVGDRQGLLVGRGQAVEIGQEAQLQVAQVKVNLPAAAQPQREDEQRQPEQEAAGVFHEGLEAGVRDLVQPGVELGEEVAQGADEDPAQLQDLPARRRCWVVCVFTRARLRREISPIRRLRRRYSFCHCWTWGSRACGT